MENTDLKEEYKSIMSRLFIIGNGFDFAGHDLNTQYKDFKNYLESEYPDAHYCGIPDTSMGHHGETLVDRDMTVGFLKEIIDRCAGKKWSTLENCLGESELYTQFEDELPYVDMDEEDDNEIYHAIYNREDDSQNLLETFPLIKKLFCEWVEECLGEIDYEGISKDTYRSVLCERSDSLYLNFNYTYTLEEGYGIQSNKVCHIHGTVDDEEQDIIFGHGDDEEVEETLDDWGTENINFTRLKQALRKPTQMMIQKHKAFFSSLNEVTDIYPFGFSFDEADSDYLTEILKHVSKNVVWHFNKYDWDQGLSIIGKLAWKGYEVKKEDRW